MRLSIEVMQDYSPCVVAMRGELSLRTVGSVAKTLVKLLLDRGEVMVDLTRMGVRWTPALQVFPTALATAGGWPFARLVLFGADQQTAAALHATSVPTTVPLALNARTARGRLDMRPSRVVRSHDLGNELASARRARALVRSACADWGLTPAVAADAAVVASELVTNAVLHAKTWARLTVSLDSQGLHVHARDLGAGRPVLLRSVGGGTTVHGLSAVAAMSKAWGITPHADGKTVWAVLTVNPPD